MYRSTDTHREHLFVKDDLVKLQCIFQYTIYPESSGVAGATRAEHEAKGA